MYILKVLSRGIVIFYFFISFFESFASDPYHNNPSILDEGKKQFDIIVQNSKNPSYGDCWNNAVNVVKEVCHNLNEYSQSKLALAITDCFLEMSGEDRYNCATFESIPERQKCIKNMPDRAFNVYSEFYTHAQNICFFLKSFIWQENTQKTIDRLSTISQVVRNKLEEVRDGHDALIENQKESLILQQNLVENGITLGQVLQESRESVATLMLEMQRSTLEQAGILGDLAAKLSALQAWAIGEVSWIESLIFYIIAIGVCYMITSLPRVENARLWLVLLLSLQLGLEQIMHKFLLGQHTDAPIYFVKENLYYWIWKLRTLIISIGCMVVGYCIYSFKDYTHENHQLLTSIHQQLNAISRGLANSNGTKVTNGHHLNSDNFSTTDLELFSDFSSVFETSSTAFNQPSTSKPLSAMFPREHSFTPDSTNNILEDDDFSFTPIPSSSNTVQFLLPDYFKKADLEYRASQKIKKSARSRKTALPANVILENEHQPIKASGYNLRSRSSTPLPPIQV